MAGTFDLRRSSDKQYYFLLRAPNVETILRSERYKAKASALNGIQSVRTNAPIDERYERKTSSAKQPYFVLKAANYEIIGTSEMYSSNAARDNGIASVKANAPGAQLVDNT